MNAGPPTNNQRHSAASTYVASRARQFRRIRAVIMDAFATLIARPGRSITMVAGIVLGVASATAAVVLADTQQVQVDRRFDLQRSGIAVVQAQSPPVDGFDTEALSDVAALPVVNSVGEVSIWRSMVTVKANSFSSPVGTPLVVLDTGGATAIGAHAIAGLDLAALDQADHTPIVWLGTTAAERLGITPSRQVISIELNGQLLTVAGFVTADPAFEYVNSAIVAPRSLANERFGGGETVRILASVRPGSAQAVASRIRSRVDLTGELALADTTPPDGQVLLGAVATDLRAAGLAVGAFVGLVGMLAVANTLNMSVTQRTRELGLRSALGWSRRRIASLILTEALVAGAVASLLGCALGLGGAALWSLYQGWQLIVTPVLPPAVIGGGVFACGVGGLAPAYHAAAIPPMTALRD